MKIIVIGATGVIGSAVADNLAAKHEVVRVSRQSDVRVDMEDPASLDALFASVTGVDAVVCCAASGSLTPLTTSTDEEFLSGLHGKLLGQVALVRRAAKHLRDGGSVTLTSGTFTRPIPGAAFGALVNSGLDAFVRAAAPELPRGIRLNVVSPGWVTETAEAAGIDAPDSTPAADVALAYASAVESAVNGERISPSRT
jgi:NAD(P)-dependent dehydrogenase (short-subunit alcohol dehydrogenase family)